MRRFVSVVMLASSLALFAGCSSPSAADDSADTSSDDLSSKCKVLDLQNAAKLMPSGSSDATVGTFEVDVSARQHDDVTGDGKWSAWSKSDSGDVVFWTKQDPRRGPVIAMTMTGAAYDKEWGSSTSTWDIDSAGVSDDDYTAYQDSEVHWYEKGNPGLEGTFDIASIKASTCTLSATSEPFKSGYSTQARFRVRIKFSAAAASTKNAG